MRVYFILALFFALAIRYTDSTITRHFQKWLKRNNYEKFDFKRFDLGASGSFGGKKHTLDKIRHEPVIFLHGNGDTALANSSIIMATGTPASGWTASISYFLSKGYMPSELYATTWGDVLADHNVLRTHDCATLIRLRAFFDAVLSYTNASKINIISHSMGVTLGRKIILGGNSTDSNGEQCYLGESLADKIGTFVGISGGNYGLCMCEGFGLESFPVCDEKTGFWPGQTCKDQSEVCSENGINVPCSKKASYAKFLMDMNEDSTQKQIASYTYSTWSLADEVLGMGATPTSPSTAMIPGSTAHKVYEDKSHMKTKETTAEDQYNMVVNHVLQ